MKMRYFKSFIIKTLLLFWGCLGSSYLFATHNRAGEITYKTVCGSGSNGTCLTYEITIVLYTKCAATTSADRCEITVDFGDGDSGVFKRVNGLPSGPGPFPCSHTCPGNIPVGEYLGNEIKKSVYRGVHTYRAPSGKGYWISINDQNRNADIVNIPQSVNVSFTISTLLIINPFLGNGENNSPVLSNPPIDDACAFECFYHNPGAFDPDGDSISYEMTECKGILSNGQPLTGYTLPHVLGGGNLTLDPVTGDLIWCSPQRVGEYNIAIKIREWRKIGNKYYEVGAIIRDMQITVKGNCQNKPPEIAAMKDTCIVAGSLFTFTVTAYDTASQYNSLQTITLSASGGAFTTTPAATFTSQPQTNIATGLLSWQTDCRLVRQQPYYVNFKATDDNFNSQNDKPLVDFKTLGITIVAPAPTNLIATPQGTRMLLSWDITPCIYATGYNIYRLDSCPNWTPGPCETGVPAYTGYKLIGTVTPRTTVTFTDNNGGKGLIHGKSYSYRVVATFNDGAMSYASLPTCEKLKRDVPVITNVDVITTSATAGVIDVKWVMPIADTNNLDTLANPGPYKIRISRADGFNGTVFTKLDSFSNAYFNNFNVLAYTDSKNLNTSGIPYTYRLDFFSNNMYIGSTQTATSVFLTITPGDNKLLLSWKEYVPWTNSSYDVYKETPTGSNTWVFIGNTPSPFFTDIGLVNGSQYCYYVESRGAYSDVTIPKPLLNKSQRVCQVPIDQEPPCPPALTVARDCDKNQNILTWNNPNNSCANDVILYRIYYTSFVNQPYNKIAEITNTGDTVFVHDSIWFNNTLTLAGCYVVTAVDSFLNESLYSNQVCIDNDSICGLKYILPNVFTPNGDNRNDWFTPLKPYKFVKDVDIKIFDRWGLLMFETTNPEILWNGTNKDTQLACPAGVYYYVCTVNVIRLKGIQPVVLRGFVHILDPSGSPPKPN